ncbi:MAG: ribonuclease P protein component [Candidatus Peregrinibacteria bacterium]
MLLHHLRGRKTNDRVLRLGTLWRGKTFQVRWMTGVPRTVWLEKKDKAPQGIYLGTFAPVSLEKRAVLRNRMRRRCKEALRTEYKDETSFPTFQLLLSPRSSSLTCAFAEIQTDVRSLFSFLRSCPVNPPKKGTASSSLR